MTLESWQSRNSVGLFDKFLPRVGHEFSVIESTKAFPTLPIDPWADCLQMIGLAWKTRFISKRDIINAVRSMSISQLLRLHLSVMGRNHKSFVNLGCQLVLDRDLPKRNQPYEEPLVEFPVFVDLHKDFRTNLGQILYGLRLREMFPKLTRDSKNLRLYLERDEPNLSPEKDAIDGILFLTNYLSRVILIFRESQSFVEDLLELYSPWVNELGADVINSASQFLHDVAYETEPPAEELIRRSVTLRKLAAIRRPFQNPQLTPADMNDIWEQLAIPAGPGPHGSWITS
jgi:hypothetical protein